MICFVKTALIHLQSIHMKVSISDESALSRNALISPGPVYSLLSSTSARQRSQRRPDILCRHLDHCIENFQRLKF